MVCKIRISIIEVSLLVACLFFCRETTFGQYITVPFLGVSTSPEANGQGSTSISRITDDDNYSIIANPAHLGL
jgi:hypothetical protein